MSESIHWFFYNLSEHDFSFIMDKNLENLEKNEALKPSIIPGERKNSLPRDKCKTNKLNFEGCLINRTARQLVKG